MHFFAVLIIFCVAYFGVSLPIFQAYSVRTRGRRFVIRLGTAWKWQDPDHRWDVLMSFLSFMSALTLAMLIWDQLMRHGYIPALPKE